jgi:hypothetical protein
MAANLYPTEPSAADAPSVATDVDATLLLKLILDEERLIILGLTAQGPKSVRELAEAFPSKRGEAATQALVAKHVAQLVEAGVLIAEGEGSYVLNVRQVQGWKRALFARATPPAPETSDDQVLATFVRRGKMVQYPAQHAKRLVVLRWLAAHFEAGRAYTEREVNEMLAGHSEDHATLRRYLVDYELLVRQGGIYRRI